MPLLEESELNTGVKLNARESTNQRERSHPPKKIQKWSIKGGFGVEGGGGDGQWETWLEVAGQRMATEAVVGGRSEASCVLLLGLRN